MDYLDDTQERSATGAAGRDRGALPGDFVDHYRVLGLEAGAGRVEIHEAFLRLKSTYSAGGAALYSLISDEEAQFQLELVEAAFRILGDEVARREYDKRYAHQLCAGANAKLGASEEHKSTRERAGAEKAAVLPVSELSPTTDRLMRARELAGGSGGAWDSRGNVAEPAADQSVVRTTRSTLPIIKLKATRVDGARLEELFADMIATSDPADGDLYRRLREAAEVSEDELQERTKVSIGYVRAIESNRFDRLPQAVYVKGFLRSYFRYLGVPDAEKLAIAFTERLASWQASRKN